MNFWSEKYVAVAIGGGIAAYKTLELLRLLRESGARVVVVATAAALRFVTPLTLQALSGNTVLSDLFTPNDADGMDHIRVAQDADLLIIAPATADIMARMAGGHGGDLLTTLLLARKKPVLLAPSMNGAMWEHPATQRNVNQLRADGITFTGPEFGPLACGDNGQGRMAQAAQIFEMGRRILSAKPLQGRRILITAGPTQEELDPVRYISNHSSGKMGWAVCNAALRAGAKVTLIHGPVALPIPWGADSVAVQSAQQMYDATLHAWDHACNLEQAPFDCAILTAAVADFRPTDRQLQKIKKNSTETRLSLTTNPDILATLSLRAKAAQSPAKQQPVVVGFAAETDPTLCKGATGAREKLARKGCDLMVVNNVLAPDCGFGSETNRVTLLYRSGHEESWPLLHKKEVGEKLLTCIANLLTQEP